MKKTTKSALIASGIVAGTAAIGALYHVTMQKLMDLALKRDEPKNIDMERGRNLLMGSSALSNVMSRIMDSAAALERRECETITIVAKDGVTLVGHWRAPEHPKRVIIAMHGWRSSWSQDFGMISDFWYDSDCAVLYAEQRGQGESGGEYMGFGLLERYDCCDWASYINERIGGTLPIYLVGISMGATTVLMATGLSLPNTVRGVIADCGFTSPSAIWRHVIEKNLHLPYALYGAAASELCKRKIQFKSDEYTCMDALRENTVPVLFIHGTDDKFVPIEMTYENYKATTAEKRLFIVPGADHGLSFLTDPEEYKNGVKAFWKDLEN